MLRAGRCASGAESQGKRKSAANRCLFLLLLHVPLYPELLEFDRMPRPEVKPLRQKSIWEQKVSKHLFEYLFYCLFSKYRRGELNSTSKEQSSEPSASFACFTWKLHLCFYFLLQTPIFRSFFRDVVPPPHSRAAVNLLTTEPRHPQDTREEEPTPRKGRITAQSVLVRPFPHRPRFDGR